MEEESTFPYDNVKPAIEPPYSELNDFGQHEAKQIVNRVLTIVSGLLVIMIIGLIVYFFKMRQPTRKIDRRKLKRKPKD